MVSLSKRNFKVADLQDVDLTGLASDQAIVFDTPKFKCRKVVDGDTTLGGSTPSTKIAPSQSAIVSAINSAVVPLNVDFSFVIKFDRNYQLKSVQISSPLTFVVDATNAVDGSVTIADVIADGSNVPSFDPSLKRWTGSGTYLNTSGIRNSLTFFRRYGKYYYTISQAVNAVAETIASLPYFTAFPLMSSPVTVGTAVVASSLGSASSNLPVTVTAAWFVDSTSVQAATLNGTYTPLVADVGKSLSLRSTATNVNGSTTVSSVSVVIVNTSGVPSVPLSFTLGTITATTIQLSWTAPATGSPSSYSVQFALAGTSFAQPTTTSVATLSTTLTGLDQNTFYDVRVAAVNSFGQGPWATITGASYVSITGILFDWDPTNITGTVQKSGSLGTGGYVFTGSVAGSGFSDGFSPDLPVLLVGGWVSVLFENITTDQCVIGVSTSRLNVNWNDTGNQLNGVVFNGSGLYSLTNGLSASLGSSIVNGDRLRIRRQTSVLLVCEKSSDGLNWVSLTTIPLSNVPQYVSIYPGRPGKRAPKPRYYNVAAASVPTAPIALAVKSTSSTSTRISFGVPNIGFPFTGYRVEFDLHNNSFANSTVALNLIGYDLTLSKMVAVVTGLVPETSYDIRIAAINSYGLGAYAIISDVNTATPTGRFLGYSATGISPTITVTGDTTTGLVITSSNSAVTYPDVVTTDPHTLLVGGWVSVLVSNLSLDRPIIGVSTSPTTNNWTANQINGLFWNGAFFFTLENGVSHAQSGAPVVGDVYRIKRTSNTTLSCETSHDGQMWTVIRVIPITSVAQYVHIYPNGQGGRALRPNGYLVV